jgi:hypothetical protein
MPRQDGHPKSRQRATDVRCRGQRGIGRRSVGGRAPGVEMVAVKPKLYRVQYDLDVRPPDGVRNAGVLANADRDLINASESKLEIPVAD